jgi:hypothetical protein
LNSAFALSVIIPSAAFLCDIIPAVASLSSAAEVQVQISEVSSLQGFEDTIDVSLF